MTDQRVFIRGNPENRGDLVPKRFPLVLASARQPAITSGSGRKELADWLADPANPLDGPRDGQPDLAMAFRRRNRAHPEQFRKGRRTADPSRVARLPGGFVYRARLVDQSRCTGF